MEKKPMGATTTIIEKLVVPGSEGTTKFWEIIPWVLPDIDIPFQVFLQGIGDHYRYDGNLELSVAEASDGGPIGEFSDFFIFDANVLAMLIAYLGNSEKGKSLLKIPWGCGKKILVIGHIFMGNQEFVLFLEHMMLGGVHHIIMRAEPPSYEERGWSPTVLKMALP